MAPSSEGLAGIPDLGGASLDMHQLQSLEAWNTAREVSRCTYRLTLAPQMRRHYGLTDQIRRAAVSIPANIAEGYALGTTPQLIRTLRISLGSAAELHTHLELLSSIALVEGAEVERLMRDTSRLIGLLVGLLKKLGAKTPGA